MKEQYVGDISDYRKYALLRALAGGGANRIGVAWMLTSSDGSTDGSKLAYLQQPERFRHFDPELFDILAHVAAEPDRRRLSSIEGANAVPGARYFNAPLSDNASEREAYMAACVTKFGSVDLVFFDPDNGLDVPSVKLGNKRSSKYLYVQEAAAFYAAGKSLLIYQHFPFIQKDVFIARCVARLQAIAPDAVIGTYRTAHVVFLLLIHPDADGRLVEAARVAASRWGAKFVAGRLYEPHECFEALLAEHLAEPPVEEPETTDVVPAAVAKADTPMQADAELPIIDEPASASKPSLLRRVLSRLR